MYGAVIGDIVGSVYEFNNIKTKDFPLFIKDSMFTDDTVMTVAVAKAIAKTKMESETGAIGAENIEDFKANLVLCMRGYGKRFPLAGYGFMFSEWLFGRLDGAYNSFGNGSAMRVSPCAIYATKLEDALRLARASAEVTHNHPEGIKGAEATAAALFLAKVKKSKAEIRRYIEDNYYTLDFTLDEIRPTYEFNETCQDTVPQAIVAFLESESFEDAIRNAISVGGDSDTLAAITGSIAWAFYGNGEELPADMVTMRKATEKKLPRDMAEFVKWFAGFCRSAAQHDR